MRSVVIVGGGTAGWLVAGVLAARYPKTNEGGLDITVLEAPDTPIIGVGEGTWPTLRRTLQSIGLSETELIRQCDASLKQGTRFHGWVNGDAAEYYHHPFTLPAGFESEDLSDLYAEAEGPLSYAERVCAQPSACDRSLAPKLITTPEYGGMLNYGYHLDAVKLGQVLRRHCCESLGVIYRPERFDRVEADEAGDIAALVLQSGERLPGDLFVDCTGLRALLIDGHFQVPFRSLKQHLFVDRALAMQVPYPSPDTPIASSTLSTAQRNGWIWDIGLSSRRGTGHVFSSAHTDEEAALLELRRYLGPAADDKSDGDFRLIRFEPGHRSQFWAGNCIAVGLASGFIEPLEASAIVMIELAAKAIADNFPSDRAALPVARRIYNAAFTYRWTRIVEFLKLHYVLSQRSDSDFWRDNRDPASYPDGLAESLDYWRHHPPYLDDLPARDEIFGPAAYHYVLFGMGMKPVAAPWLRSVHKLQKATAKMAETERLRQQLCQILPGNRQLLEKIAQFGLQKV
jgi:flavin-dependent dehydrogenase